MKECFEVCIRNYVAWNSTIICEKYPVTIQNIYDRAEKNVWRQVSTVKTDSLITDLMRSCGNQYIWDTVIKEYIDMGMRSVNRPWTNLDVRIASKR